MDTETQKLSNRLKRIKIFDVYISLAYTKDIFYVFRVIDPTIH